jgi:exopolysaccharide biosynthesis polyprenyl glycosylphosphotransferase
MSFYLNSFKEKKFLVLGDIVIVFIAFFSAVLIKYYQDFYQDFSFSFVLERLDLWKIAWMFFYPVLFYIFELYNYNTWLHNIRLLLCICTAVLTAACIVTILSYIVIPHIIIGRTILFIHTALIVPLLFVWRKIFFNLYFKGNNNKHKVLLIGSNAIVNDIESLMRSNSHFYSDDIKTIRNYSENPETVRIEGAMAAKSIPELITHDKIDTVIVADNLKECPILKKQLLDLKFKGITIYDAHYFYEVVSGKVPVKYVDDSWFLFRRQGKAFHLLTYRKAKKIVDLTLALFALILTAPLMLLGALCVKLSSKGPVLFKQERLGQNERPFTLIKFRTMIDNAEKNTGPKWASENDPRITNIGRFLRKSRLDELPQLINVLKGEMSFVGPRPIRKYAADMLAYKIPHYRIRFIVKPGVTGWAQVCGDYGVSIEGQKEKLTYDLFYIQNQSMFFDLFIMLKTAQTLLFRKGH